MTQTQLLTRLCMVTFLSTAATALSAATTVYKVKNPDGSISYSDQQQDNAEVLQVEPVPTIPSVPVDRSAYGEPDVDADAGAGYSSFTITAPENGSAFHSPEGFAEVSVTLEPSLQDSHTFEYWLDGKLYQSTQAQAVQLSNLDRGTHSLEVKIVDGAGNVIDSKNASFTLHRPIANPKENTGIRNRLPRVNP